MNKFYLPVCIPRYRPSRRIRCMAMMMFCFAAAAVAQNTAGDYSAGTTALTTVTEEIAKYVPITVKLCYSIAGVVAIVGAISVHIAIDNALSIRLKIERI